MMKRQGLFLLIFCISPAAKQILALIDSNVHKHKYTKGATSSVIKFRLLLCCSVLHIWGTAAPPQITYFLMLLNSLKTSWGFCEQLILWGWDYPLLMIRNLLLIEHSNIFMASEYSSWLITSTVSFEVVYYVKNWKHQVNNLKISWFSDNKKFQRYLL